MFQGFHEFSIVFVLSWSWIVAVVVVFAVWFGGKRREVGCDPWVVVVGGFVFIV